MCIVSSEGGESCDERSYRIKTRLFELIKKTSHRMYYQQEDSVEDTFETAVAKILDDDTAELYLIVNGFYSIAFEKPGCPYLYFFGTGICDPTDSLMFEKVLLAFLKDLSYWKCDEDIDFPQDDSYFCKLHQRGLHSCESSGFYFDERICKCVSIPAESHIGQF